MALSMLGRSAVTTRPATQPRIARHKPLHNVAVPLRTRCVLVRATVSKEQVLEDVRGIISEQLGTEKDKVTGGSKFADLGADSLDTVEIMMALEEKFNITLDEEGAEKISTVQEAADLISGQIASK